MTVGPDLTYNGGIDDAFVAKVNAAGTALVYCGYIGGSGDDYGHGIAVDSSGNAYVTGFATSTEATFPVTVGPDLTYNGGGDAFVAKIGGGESRRPPPPPPPPPPGPPTPTATPAAGSDPAEPVQIDPSWQTSRTLRLASPQTQPPPAGRSPDVRRTTGGRTAKPTGAGTGDCDSATGDCYLMTVSGTRPATHWDATFVETLSLGGSPKTWTLHIGNSFTDVSTDIVADPYYPFIETIFHKQVTAGCLSGTQFCPTNPTTRDQMAVFLLKASLGSTYVPPQCTPPGIFSDVPCTPGVGFPGLDRGPLQPQHHGRLLERPRPSTDHPVLPDAKRPAQRDGGLPPEDLPGLQLRAAAVHAPGHLLRRPLHPGRGLLRTGSRTSTTAASRAVARAIRVRPRPSSTARTTTSCARRWRSS